MKHALHVLVRLCLTLAFGLAFVAGTARFAHAYPYDLYAKYTVDGGSTSTVVKLGTDGNLLPGDPINAAFLGLFLKGKSDDLAKMELERLSGVAVDVYTTSSCLNAGSDEPLSFFVTAKDLLAGTEKLLVEPVGTCGKGVGDMRIEVRSRFSGNFLCEQELKLRQDKGQLAQLTSVPELKNAARAKEKGPVAKEAAGFLNFVEPVNTKVLTAEADTPAERASTLAAYSTLFNRALLNGERQPIVFSFCSEISKHIRWDAVASIGASEFTQDPAKAEAAHSLHKQWLANLLVAALRDSGAAETIRYEKHGSDKWNNMYAYLEHRVAMLMDTSDLELQEVGSGPGVRLPNVVDMDSMIALSVLPKSHFCASIAGCSTVIGSKLRVLMSYKDKSGKDISVTTSLRPVGNGWLVAEDLTKFLGTRLSFTIYYATETNQRLDLLGTIYYANVENIGLVTTAPLITDIIAATKVSKAEAATMQSSIPLSWGINLSQSEYAHAAITFPWMIGFNTRAYPRLADYIKVFPAVSVIFPLEDDTGVRSTRVGFGGGIALANFFTFSAAATVQGTPQAFLLIGVSAPDLTKL